MGVNGVTYPFLGVRRSYLRQSVLIPAVLLLLVTTAGRIGSLQWSNRYAAQLENSSVVSRPLKMPAAKPNTQLGISPGSTAPSSPTANPICSPDTTYRLPTELDLAAAPAGLTQQTDPIHLYRIYGLSVDELRQQIARCAPKLSGDSEFTGYTVYNLSWRYNFVITASDQCALDDVKVGLHTSEVLPLWQPSPLASSAFASKWQVFATNLHRHEQGHAALDTQYATRLTSALQTLSTNDCNDLTVAAKSMIQRTVANLNQANESYDALTNHGATQGAVLN